MELEQNLKTLRRRRITDPQISVSIEKLKVWLPAQKSRWRRRIIKPKTMILENVTGCIEEDEFVAIIGPSGAGKTTFLVSLAGKCSLPSEGTMTVNGVNVSSLQRGFVEIVPQFDVFMDGLTVMEHLAFMTEMKLGSCSISPNREILNTLISELKLQARVSTTIRSLSGGERRLLTLASALLSNPRILICDEPTTGLDSYNAALVVGVLKKLASSGNIVICSVHQPSSDLFKEFSSIMLMAEGKLLFHGSQDDCRILFESINLWCPENYNPAEFYIRAISTSSSKDDNYSDLIYKIYQDRFETCDTTLQLAPTTHHDLAISQRNWFKQVHLLLWRSSLTLKNDLRNHFIQLLITVVTSSLIIGTCYVGITGTTQRGIQDLRGFLWLLCSEVAFSLAYNALYVFESQLTLFKREVGMYSASAYFVARFLSFFPRCVIWPVTFISLATLAVELPNHVVTAVEFVVALVVTAVGATAYGLGMGALFTSTGIMGDVMPCVDLPLFLMSGAFFRLSSMPSWLFPVKYISHFYYGMDAISNIYWRKIYIIDCPANSTGGCIDDGQAVLMENGYSSNFVLQDSLGMLLVTLMWSLLGYCGLKREERKGYAY